MQTAAAETPARRQLEATLQEAPVERCKCNCKRLIPATELKSKRRSQAEPRGRKMSPHSAIISAPRWARDKRLAHQATKQLPERFLQMPPLLCNTRPILAALIILLSASSILQDATRVSVLVWARNNHHFGSARFIGQAPSFLNAFHLPMSAPGSDVGGASAAGSSISSNGALIGSSSAPSGSQEVGDASGAPAGGFAANIASTNNNILRRDLGVSSRYFPSSASLSSSSANPSNLDEQSIGGSAAGKEHPATAKSKVCQVNDGESVAILEIEESRGSDMSQSTNPVELPIGGGHDSDDGQPSDDIELKIESETHKYFRIEDNKRLRLIRPLDRDATLRENSTTQLSQQPISSIYLQISCVQKGPEGGQRQKVAKKVIIPVLVKVLDLNDNAPKFSQPVYTIQVDEMAPVGTILTSQVHALDLDSANNGQVEYSLLGGAGSGQGSASSGSGAQRARPSSQRLIERDDSHGNNQASTSSSPHQPATGNQVIMATTTTTTPTTTTRTPPPPDSSSASPSISQAIHREPSDASSPTDISATSTSPAPRSTGSPPTINLNSEPILNGPMDELEDEESDEALLASLNGGAANSSSLEPPPGQEEAESLARQTTGPSDQLLAARPQATTTNYHQPADGKRRRRRRRSHPLASPNEQQQSSAGAAVTSGNDQHDATSVSGPKRHLSPPPWTNLMTLTTADDLMATNYADSRQQTRAELSGANANETRQQHGQLATSGGGGGSNGGADLHPSRQMAALASPSLGQDFFGLEISPQTGRPIIRLKRPLDYETQRTHSLVIQATDLAANRSARLTGQATILIKVLDGDDQPPAFVLDQTGCATSSPTQTTASMMVESPGAALAPAAAYGGSGGGGSPTTIRPPISGHQETVGSGKQSPAVAAPADELSFDFGDTLGLDDSPIEEPDLVASPAGGVSRSRRLPATMGPASSAPSGQAMASGQPPASHSYRRHLAPSDRGPSGAASQLHHLRHQPHLRMDQHQCLAGLQALRRHRQQHSELLGGGQAGPNQQPSDYPLAEYYSTIMSDDSEYLLRIVPQAIKARDRDELNAPIRYSILNATLIDHQHYFQINPSDGSIKQIAPIERLVAVAAIQAPGSAANTNANQLGPNHQLVRAATQASGASESAPGQGPAGPAGANQIVLWIQAQEVSQNKLSALAKLTVEVVPSDKSPPVLVPNSYFGFIEENSPVGSRIMVANPRLAASGASSSTNKTAAYLQVQVLDGDAAHLGASAGPASADGEALQTRTPAGNTNKFEFDTTSDVFKVDQDGYVYVARGKLDCDSPHQASHLFQVTARQLGLVSSRSISSPISLNVSLLDVNDNGPQLVNSSLAGPLQMPANSRGGVQIVTQLRAIDLDQAPENSRMHFALRHVSNMGKERFRIDEESGQIEALGRFQAGEQFSLTVQVSDELGRQSQAIIEVLIGPGANTGPPQFVDVSMEESGGLVASSATSGQLNQSASSGPDSAASDQPTTSEEARQAGSGSRARQHQSVDGSGAMQAKQQSAQQRPHQWSVEVNEALAVGSVVLQVRAADPENDPISYSLVEGNSNGDFQLNSRTGLLSVAHKLDREEISAYNLLVQARDSGGLATSRQLQITITDSNDQNPVFEQAHYLFEVEEGVRGRKLGRVCANDGDLGENGRVSYSLAWLANDDHPQQQANQSRRLFAIDESTGVIELLAELDYEQSRSHTLLVSASDHGETPRTSSVSVQVRVLDVQDEEPDFERFHYEIRVEENRAQQRIALVQARDPDSRSQISYVLLAGDSGLFQVDPVSGWVSTGPQGLDYETSKTHTILIGTNESSSQPGFDLVGASNRIAESLLGTTNEAGQTRRLDRSPIVRIDLQVLDVNDNAPQFLDPQPMPIRVQDSAPLGHQVMRLQASDADGSAPNNQVRYELLVEADEPAGPGELQPAARARPFSSATTTSDKCARLFLVDPTSGSLMIRSDLRRELTSECQLWVRAHDLAEQVQSRLGSTIGVIVLIDHLAEISPSAMVGFADSSFTAELSESSASNSLVRVLPVVNKPKTSDGVASWPMSCELVSGNELGHFYVIANEQRDCELRTRDDSLDYEQKSRFLLTIRLNTIGSLSGSTIGGASAGSGSSTQHSGPPGASYQANAPKLIAQVQVNLLDRNDNRPTFGQPSRYNQLTQQRYLAAIAHDSPSETQVIQMRAQDLDGQAKSNGLVSYELLNELELENRFKIDPLDGVIRTCKPIEDLPATRLPIKLRVLARDNPESAGESLESTTEVILNLIDDKSRICLSLKDTPPSRVLDTREELLSALQERTGLISGLERVESLKLQRNSSYVEADVTGTDVWFYLIEPGTLRILPSDDGRIRAALFDSRAQSSLFDVLGQTLGFNKAKIRLPHSQNGASLAADKQSRASGASLFLLGAIRADSSDRLAPALILIALFIGLVSAIVLIYQCGTTAGWSLATHGAPQPGGAQQHQLASMLAAKEKLFNYCANYPAQYQLGPASNCGGAQTPLPGHPQHSFNNNSFIGQGSYQHPTVAGLHQPKHHQHLQAPALAEQQNPLATANGHCHLIGSKEYETQMLKMSVLFDDGHSLDEQNLNDNQIISKNLV